MTKEQIIEMIKQHKNAELMEIERLGKIRGALEMLGQLMAEIQKVERFDRPEKAEEG